MTQVHTRQEIYDRNLENYLREMRYALGGIEHELTEHQNVAFSTEYIREKIRIISRACDALDHDMELLQHRERLKATKKVKGNPNV